MRPPTVRPPSITYMRPMLGEALRQTPPPTPTPHTQTPPAHGAEEEEEGESGRGVGQVSRHAQSGADMGDEASECVGCGEETPRQSLTRCPNCYGDYCPSCYDTHTEPWKRRREEGNLE